MKTKECWNCKQNSGPSGMAAGEFLWCHVKKTGVWWKSTCEKWELKTNEQTG